MSNQDKFNAAVPDDIQKLLLKTALDSCRGLGREALDRCPEMVVDLVPMLRRVIYQTALGSMVAPSGYQMSMHWHRSSSATNLELVFNRQVVLTTLTRSIWSKKIAVYSRLKKIIRAAGAGQRSFLSSLGFEDFEAVVQDVDDPIYALLLYGGSHRRDTISFAHIVFPDSDGRVFKEDSINLFCKFPEVVSNHVEQYGLQPEDIPEVEPELEPELDLELVDDGE